MADEPHTPILEDAIRACVAKDCFTAMDAMHNLWNQGFQSTDIMEALLRVLKYCSMPSETLRLTYLNQYGQVLHRQDEATTDEEISLAQVQGLIARFCNN